eukprot:1149143-Pelagomonas_calceolata.AAC.3
MDILRLGLPISMQKRTRVAEILVFAVYCYTPAQCSTASPGHREVYSVILLGLQDSGNFVSNPDH